MSIAPCNCPCCSRHKLERYPWDKNVWTRLTKYEEVSTIADKNTDLTIYDNKLDTLNKIKSICRIKLNWVNFKLKDSDSMPLEKITRFVGMKEILEMVLGVDK